MSDSFWFSNGQKADNADDLIKLCQQFPEDSSQYLVREDFEKWLAYIGETRLAKCASEARQTNLGDRQKLEEFLTKCNPQTTPKSDEAELAIEKRPGNFVDAIKNFFSPKSKV